MAQLKFYRKNVAPTEGLVAGAIWFNTSDKTIQIYTGSEWEKYAGNLKDATWSIDKKTLTITKHDGYSIALDFSDMASATVMGKMLTAVGLDTDGTFKKNATNYGGSATSIGGEISAIDTKLKSVSDLVGTTAIATQITNAKTELIGKSTDDKTANTIGGAKTYAADAASGAQSGAQHYTDEELKKLSGEISSTADEKVVVKVNQTNGKVDTVTVELDDIASASELANVKKTAEDAQTAGEVTSAITGAIGKLNADKTGESDDKHVKVQVVEAAGVLTGVTVTTDDIASAATLAEVKGTVDAFFKGADIAETAETYKDTLKELQTYITEDAAAAVTMTESIATNKNNIGKLASAKVNNKNFAVTQIGTDGTTTITSAGVILNGADIKIDGYTKGTAADLTTTDTINQALGKLEARVDAAAAGGVQSVNGKTGAVTIVTGTSNGSIKVGDADVAVKGLGSAAYTASTAYATKAQGDKADSALQAITSANTAAIEITNKSVVTPKIVSNSELMSEVYMGNAAGTSPLVDAAGVTYFVKTYVAREIETALEWAEF